MSQRSPKIIVAPSVLGGRGIIAIADIDADELIEICPVLVIPAGDVPLIHRTVLHDYYFLWGDGEEQAAIALGYGSLYNHADDSNALYEMDFTRNTLDIYAYRDIRAGEEVTINYHGSPGSRDALWFEDRNTRGEEE